MCVLRGMSLDTKNAHIKSRKMVKFYYFEMQLLVRIPTKIIKVVHKKSYDMILIKKK